MKRLFAPVLVSMVLVGTAHSANWQELTRGDHVRLLVDLGSMKFDSAGFVRAWVKWEYDSPQTWTENIRYKTKVVQYNIDCRGGRFDNPAGYIYRSDGTVATSWDLPSPMKSIVPDSVADVVTTGLCAGSR
ncbi:surface-adhesin E family protein [Burkholderia sp. AU15512]|uniref:surface-adhesin E family protein n=1 Tax=Burkholderia sp. AU15512 TaxID=2015345 RepID=UPI0035944C73